MSHGVAEVFRLGGLESRLVWQFKLLRMEVSAYTRDFLAPLLRWDACFPGAHEKQHLYQHLGSTGGSRPGKAGNLKPMIQHGPWWDADDPLR